MVLELVFPVCADGFSPALTVYSDLREYNYTLGKISGNLNQIAKRMNATGNVYKADVEEVKKLMKQVWDTQKSMLSKQPTMKQ